MHTLSQGQPGGSNGVGEDNKYNDTLENYNGAADDDEEKSPRGKRDVRLADSVSKNITE